MIKSHTQSWRSAVVVDVVVFVVVVVAGAITFAHGHDFQRLSHDHRARQGV